jgi:hypothetical protein
MDRSNCELRTANCESNHEIRAENETPELFALRNEWLFGGTGGDKLLDQRRVEIR